MVMLSSKFLACGSKAIVVPAWLSTFTSNTNMVISMTNTPALLSMRDVTRITTLSRTAINNLRKAGKFPEPVPLGERRFAFAADEVTAWVSARMKQRKGAPAKEAA